MWQSLKCAAFQGAGITVQIHPVYAKPEPLPLGAYMMPPMPIGHNVSITLSCPQPPHPDLLKEPS
jgi:hypothetical protein